MAAQLDCKGGTVVDVPVHMDGRYRYGLGGGGPRMAC